MKKLLLVVMGIVLAVPVVVNAAPPAPPFKLKTYVKEEHVLLQPGKAANITISCDTGDMVLSGAYRRQSDAVLHHFEPAPNGSQNPTGWRFVIANPTEMVINNALEVLCLDQTP